MGSKDILAFVINFMRNIRSTPLPLTECLYIGAFELTL